MNVFLEKLVKLFSEFISILPYRLQFFLGDLIGSLWFDVLRIRRKVALENLSKCFPNWSEKERLSVARASVCHIGRSFVEFLRIPAVSEKDKNHFVIHNLHFYDDAMKQGLGAFLLTSHVGNGDWATVGLALHGCSIDVITKEMTVKWFNNFWFNTRKKLGTNLIPARGSSLTILKRLKQNRAIAFTLDQFMGPPIGVKTTFFGRETGTAMGLAILASRSKAPVLPVYTYRDEKGVTHVHFESEILFEESNNKEETVQKMTQKYCDKIEEWVRQYPRQWMWVHRRWKVFKN